MSGMSGGAAGGMSGDVAAAIAAAQAAAIAAGLGVGQTWQNMTGSRQGNTNYVNTTGKPIMVAVDFSAGGGTSWTSLIVNSVEVGDPAAYSSAGGSQCGVRAIVPSGGTYSFNGGPSLAFVMELR